MYALLSARADGVLIGALESDGLTNSGLQVIVLVANGDVAPALDLADAADEAWREDPGTPVIERQGKQG